jgi:hypothetical protein
MRAAQLLEQLLAVLCQQRLLVNQCSPVLRGCAASVPRLCVKHVQDSLQLPQLALQLLAAS